MALRCCRFAFHKLARSPPLFMCMCVYAQRLIQNVHPISAIPTSNNNISHTSFMFFMITRAHTYTRMNTLKYDSIIPFMLINCFFMQLTHSLICCYYCYYHLAYFLLFLSCFPILQFSSFYLLFDVMIMMMLIISRAQFKPSTADGRCSFEKEHIRTEQNRIETSRTERNKQHQRYTP